MVESGDYITPKYHDRNRFDKPVLFYWLVSAFYKLIGINLAAARFVSVLFGVLSIWVVYFLAKRLFDQETALLSAFILPSCYLFFRLTRWAITDMALSFFILLAFFFFIRGYQDGYKRKTDFLLFYASMALGFMIKGPAAVIIPATAIAFFLLCTSDRGTFRRMHVPLGLVILAAIILPWFVSMWVLYGEEFTNHILSAEIRERVADKYSFNFYYLNRLFRYFLPWSLFIIFSLAFHFGITTLDSKNQSGGWVLSGFSAEKYYPVFTQARAKGARSCFILYIVDCEHCSSF